MSPHARSPRLSSATLRIRRQIIAVSPSAPSDSPHDGKPNVTGAENPLIAVKPLGPSQVLSNISAESRNAPASSSPAAFNAPAAAANISAILTSAASPRPLANAVQTP